VALVPLLVLLLFLDVGAAVRLLLLLLLLPIVHVGSYVRDCDPDARRLPGRAIKQRSSTGERGESTAVRGALKVCERARRAALCIGCVRVRCRGEVEERVVARAPPPGNRPLRWIDRSFVASLVAAPFAAPSFPPCLLCPSNFLFHCDHTLFPCKPMWNGHQLKHVKLQDP
jgi:hypothetical protein